MTRILWGEGPLKLLLPTLANLLTADSQEYKTLESMKNKQKETVVHRPLPSSIPGHPSPSQAERPCTPTRTHPRSQSSYQTPVNQRTASGSSFGTHSTETTPNKLGHAEPKVQALQNEFVKCILNELWTSQIDLSWVKGRRMSLIYSEYRPHRSLLTLERVPPLSNIQYVETRRKYWLVASKLLQTVASG